MADVGQEEDFAAAEKKAMAIGAKKFFCVVSWMGLSISFPFRLTRPLSAYPTPSFRSSDSLGIPCQRAQLTISHV